MLLWLDCALFLVSVALVPVERVGARALPPAARTRLPTLRQAQRRDRQLSDRNVQAMKLVVTSNAQEREVRAVPPQETTRSCGR